MPRRRKNRYKARGRGLLGSLASRLVAVLKLTGAAALAGSMAVAFIFGYDVVTQCAFFRARTVSVEGLKLLSREQVLDQAGVSEGDNILSVNIGLARKHLLAHPLVAGASVSRELPDTLRIVVEEHAPLAVLDLERKFLINTRGEIYKELEPTDPQGLPVVTGLSFSDIQLDGKPGSPSFEAVMEVLHLGLRKERVLPAGKIQRIDVDREIGLTLYGGEAVGSVKIGYSRYETKLGKLEEILLLMKSRESFSRLESVDLINLNRIVVTPADPAPTVGDDKEV